MEKVRATDCSKVGELHFLFDEFDLLFIVFFCSLSFLHQIRIFSPCRTLRSKIQRFPQTTSHPRKMVLSVKFSMPKLELSLSHADEERRVKLKTDLFILPLLCGVFFLQYIDKQSLSYASVFGLITDLKLKGTEYSWCASIIYIGK